MVSAIRPDKRPTAAKLSAEYAPGDVIIREGDLGEEMFIIEEGEVEIFKTVAGTERVLVTLERGDFFGEMAMLEDEPRSSSAHAVTPSKLMRINRELFDDMLRQNPQVAVRMMRKLSRRLRELHAAVESDDTVDSKRPPVPTEVPASGARLIHDSGAVFPLSSGRETTLGRFDRVTGVAPTVDLQTIDAVHGVSRRHAIITHVGDNFEITEEIGTSNGTFLNGERLKTGVHARLKDGDRIRLGNVELTFRSA